MKKVALVYDRVNTPYGGAENVLEALHEVFLDAPLYTSVYDPEKSHWAKKFQVIPSFLNAVPGAKRLHRVFVAAMPFVFESFNLDAYDVVISVTSAEAKGILTKSHQLHVCYLLTPTRYLWSHGSEYEKHWLSGWLRKLVFRYLKWWDTAAAARPDVFIPISRCVAERCQNYYQRPTEAVIYPPVSEAAFGTDTEQVTRPVEYSYYLVVARLVPYKKIDLAIQACQKAGKNLVIIGTGPDLERLKKIAKIPAATANPTAKVEFLQAVQPHDIIAYYKYCEAFLAPGEEDFGITALEAQAQGKPVIIHHQSGAAEIVQDGKTGIHIFEESVEAIAEAIHITASHSWDESFIRQRVKKYRTQQFQKNFSGKIEKLWQQFRSQMSTT